MVNIGDTRVSFSWENLDDGSISEAAIKLKACAKVRTLKFFVRVQLFYLTLQEPELSLSTDTQASFSPVVEQGRAARLPSGAHLLPLPCQCSWDQQHSPLEGCRLSSEYPVTELGPLTGPLISSTPDPWACEISGHY